MTRDDTPAPAAAHDFFDTVGPLLACPDCRAGVAPDAAGTTLRCTRCGAGFAVHDGIAQFARFGSTERWLGDSAVPAEPAAALTSEAYQRNYQLLPEAQRYNEMYSQRWHKRWATRREQTLLERLLGSQPRSRTMLDLPCGGGRLSSQLARHTELLIEADIALGQLLYGRSHGLSGLARVRQVLMTASGFHIPLRDQAVDAVVCVRLNHHLPTAEERERLVRELMRVARRFVIMTFFDQASLKNRLRQLRRPFDHKPPKLTMSVPQLRRLAEDGGFALKAQPALEPLTSGHRYALMVRQTAA